MVQIGLQQLEKPAVIMGEERDACGKNHSQHSNWILMLSWKCFREPATLWLPDTEVVGFFFTFLVFLNKLETPSGEGTSTCS